MSRRALGSLAALALLPALSLISNDARACGGCFTGGGDPTIVTGHRMALSISMDQTVLWDQIRYQGDPEEFAWVLPVRPGATIELASNAFFEALDAATTVNVFPPPGIFCNAPTDDYDDYDDGYYDDYDDGGPSYFGACSMAGCSAEGSGPDGSFGSGGGAGSFGDGGGMDSEPPPVVEVVHEESIGPYEAVILSSNEPGALYDWLLSHGYAIDPDMEPVIDGYEADGFDFVALRLIPGTSARQMTPVRVTSPGAAPVLPLKMVAAGTGAKVGMTLFVIGEGRWEAQGFANEQIDPAHLDWGLATSSSNYDRLRTRALGGHDGSTWLTTYSQPGALLSPVYNPVSMQYSQYLASNGMSASSIAGLYAAQGYANGEITDMTCVDMFHQVSTSGGKVVDPCAAPPDTGEDGSGGSGGVMRPDGDGGAGGDVPAGGAGGAPADGGAMAAGGAGGVMRPDGNGGTGGTGGTGGIMRPDGSAGSPAGGGAGLGGAGGAGGEPVCTGTVGPDEIDARQLACGDLDDVATALVGMRPVNVWLTRLEADLPRRALGADLGLQASMSQAVVDNWMFASTYTGDPCSPGAAPVPPPRGPEPRNRPPVGAGDLLAMGVVLSMLLGAAARRHLRPARAARAV